MIVVAGSVALLKVAFLLMLTIPPEAVPAPPTPVPTGIGIAGVGNVEAPVRLREEFTTRVLEATAVVVLSRKRVVVAVVVEEGEVT